MKRDSKEYIALQKAYAYFNKLYFDEELPEVFFLFDYHVKKATGFFAPDKMQFNEDETAVNVISLNPDFLNRTVYEVVGTLVHEMCHVWEWQNKKKKPSSVRNYHSKVWQDKMSSCDLVGEVNKTRTAGYTVIPENGKFIEEVDEYVRTNDWLTVRSSDAGNAEAVKLKKKKASAKNKTKYTCPDCGTNIWGKAELSILCNDCNVAFEEAE